MLKVLFVGLKFIQKKVSKSIIALTSLSCFSAVTLLPMALPVNAETLARVDASCKLIVNQATVFDNHCVFKHKKRDNIHVFAVELDNGQTFAFRGPSVDSLQVEDYAGVHNVQFKETDGGNKDVFNWTNQGVSNKLVVKLKSQSATNASTNSTPQTTPSNQDALGALIGAGVGALIGSLIAGGSSSQAAPQTTTVVVGQPVSSLSDLVGAKGGQAEGALQRRGYTYVKASQQADSAYSNWRENSTGNCIAIRTTDGRYAAIVYAPKSDCQ